MDKVIFLTKNQRTTVSFEDFDYLNQFKWHYHSKGYATRCIRLKGNWKKRKQILMHKVILKRMGIEVPEGFVSDHIDGNKLDNRRSNLRVVTPTQSNFNRLLSSSFVGVSFNKNCKKWHARIKTKHLGYFNNKEKAIIARRKAEVEMRDYDYARQ